MWVSGLVTAVLLMASSLAVRWDFGVVAPGGWMLCWCEGAVRVGHLYKDPGFLVNLRHMSVTDGFRFAGLSSMLWNCRVDVPAWFSPLPPFAFCVLAWWMTRSKPSGCSACGYDLAGLSAAPGGAVVCPECGKGDAKVTA